MINTAKATINLTAIKENLAVAKRLAPQSNVLAMIKADAYGHGLIEVARHLSAADALGVARLSEAISLRKAGITQRIVVMGSLLDSADLHLCAARNIDCVVHDEMTWQLLLEHPPASQISLWLKLDSGMHRLGLTPAELQRAIKQLQEQHCIKELVAMTHLSESEVADVTITRAQTELLLSTAGTSGLALSVANSAAILQHPDSHQQWIRPGIMLYGANPVSHIKTEYLFPAMRLSAPVVALRWISSGETVGYNQRWCANRHTLLATVGIGYGDGYPRHAIDGTPVWINGQRAPLAGRVSMDLITVDVTECTAVAVGDEVELWGENLRADEVAPFANTIAYQLFTGVTQRVERCYVETPVRSKS